ncbi:MAG: UDP-N-acetylglucosamine 1-carboxyvinyltransferase [Bacteroides sp.]|nr:MAG: UDP-N-acetylglucosamine 1-carboxyvinyltransferase [Bacteroides sp.]
MEYFEIIGNNKLEGCVTPQGSKNEALQIIAATILTDHKVTIKNIPNIRDVNILIDILDNLGVTIKKINNNIYSFQAKTINLNYLFSENYKKSTLLIRGSILLIGPLLSRYGFVKMFNPGGDKIGRRKIDTHLLALKHMGAVINFYHNTFDISCKKLKGGYIILEEASVTGTANIIMASVLAKGKTYIYNAACDPYITQLCIMLCNMGAQISGIRSNLLIINGVDYLIGTQHNISSDIIEIGSFIGLSAVTNSNIRINNIDMEFMHVIINNFKKLGINIDIINNDILITDNKHYSISKYIDGSILTISDAPWPGLTPDLISIIIVTAIQAEGNILIHQKMFESRLFFVDKLIDMGGQIILCDPHRAVVMGLNRKNNLQGTNMTSPDIRAGVSLLIAALSANGKSIIKNIEQIDRGYENIDKKINLIGGKINRIFI